MAAHSAPFEAGFKPGHIVLYKIAASTTIYKGALVALDTDGYVTPMTHATASLKFMGVAEETVTNDGADGDASVRVAKEGSYVIAGSGTQADIGKEVYALDDATIQLTTGGLTNSYKVGTVLGIENTSKGAAGMRIRIENYTV
jgi:hypothetical protein